MGIFIAICALKSQSPFIYILAGLVLIIDGGLGLVKVSLLRFLKIHILKNTTTPIHDHVRKKLGLVKCTGRFQICNYPDCCVTRNGLSGDDLTVLKLYKAKAGV